MPLEAIPYALGDDQQPQAESIRLIAGEDEPWYCFFPPPQTPTPIQPFSRSVVQVTDELYAVVRAPARKAAWFDFDPVSAFQIPFPVPFLVSTSEEPDQSRVVDVTVAAPHDVENLEGWTNLIILSPLGGVLQDYPADVLPDTSSLCIANMAAATFSSEFDWINFTPAPPSTPPGGVIVYWWGGQEFAGPSGNLEF